MMIDISNARLSHLKWLLQLEQLLRQESAPNLQTHQACDLGIWLRKDGIRRYGQYPEISFLEKRHQHFHETADLLVTLFQARNYVEAEVALDELKRDSQDLIFMLTMIEYRMMEKMNAASVIV
jgi:hypothetical protein